MDRGIRFAQWVFPDTLVLARGELANPTDFASILRTHFAPPGAEDIHYPDSLLSDFPDRLTMTDTHYSPIGCLHLADAVAESMLGCSDPAYIARRLADALPTKRYVGDLGVQCDPPISEDWIDLAAVTGTAATGNGVQAGNNGIILLLERPSAITDETLLIFGDSFFRSLLPDLSHYWARIVFVRTPFFHFEIVRAVAPETILMGMAERYLPTTQGDAERPHVLAHPLMRGRSQSPDPGFAEMWTRLVDPFALAQVADVPLGPLPKPTPSTRPREIFDPGRMEEQVAFSLWLQEDGARDLDQIARSAEWARVLPKYLKRARHLILIMGRQGVRLALEVQNAQP